MEKLKELDSRIEVISKQPRHKSQSNPPSSSSTALSLMPVFLSIVANLDYLRNKGYFENDEAMQRLQQMESLYQDLTAYEKLPLRQRTRKHSDYTQELKKLMKFVAPRDLHIVHHFLLSTQYLHPISSSNSNTNPISHWTEYMDLFAPFFTPISAEMVTDEKEIHQLMRNNKTYQTSAHTAPFPSYKVNSPSTPGPRQKILQEKLEGITLIFPLPNQRAYLTIYGFFEKDPFQTIFHHPFFEERRRALLSDLEYVDAPKAFKDIYLHQIPIRDVIHQSPREIIQALRSDYEDLQTLVSKNLTNMIKDFYKAGIERQRKIVTLFLMHETQTQFSVHVLSNLATNQEITYQGKPLFDAIYETLPWKIQQVWRQSKKREEDEKRRVEQIQMQDIPYETRIARLATSAHVKSKAYEKLKEVSGSKDNSVKAQQWLDGLLKIPFGVYKEEKILKFFDTFSQKVSNHMEICTAKIAQTSEEVLSQRQRKMYHLTCGLVDYHKKNLRNQSDREYESFIEKCEEALIRYMVYQPSLQERELKSNYNKDLFLRCKQEYETERSVIELMKSAPSLPLSGGNGVDGDEDVDIESESSSNFHLSYFQEDGTPRNIRVGKERSGSVELTNDDIFAQLDLQHLTPRNKRIMLKMMESNQFPSEELLDRCLKELSQIRKIKNELLEDQISNASYWRTIMDRLSALESTLFLPSISDEDELADLVDINKGEEMDMEVEVEDEDYHRFIQHHFEELDTFIHEWHEFKRQKKEYMKYIDRTLDKCVHGHLESKQQMKRLVGQMMNSRKKKGFCLGLQGPPGVGKTTICLNGLAKCLVDENNESRPIIFIPLGGSANGSTLEGHNYTYLGSIWGKIADALMEAKCMNPIIFIDELDKISKTEHGREISSILTHLTDQTQNHEFFDKYFQSIPLDLSKVIFIFSYNDRDNVDKILLDRIQEIRIKPLSKQDKVIISKNYVLPEIYKNTGFSRDEIYFPSRLLSTIIESYTYEAGVRKLSEILNDIIREINLRKIMGEEYEYPIQITPALVDEILGDKPKMTFDRILDIPLIGVSYGMYASSSGYGGGISKIQTVFVPSGGSSGKKVSIQKTTGLAGEMMKESFDVCMTVAYNLIPDEMKRALQDREDTGIHIHFNDSSVNKDGPSGGQAITLALVSLLTQRKVRNNVAITGEINLLGFSMKIGGVHSKINGSIRAGITTFIIPKENREDIVQMIRMENRTTKNLQETYGGEAHAQAETDGSPTSLSSPIPMQKNASFLTLESFNKAPGEEEDTQDAQDIRFHLCEYEGVEWVSYKGCRVYLVDNIYQVLKIALEGDIEFKSLYG